MTREARLVDTGAGLRPAEDGWFVVNLADAEAIGAPGVGHAFTFEGDARFPEFGINVHVLQPGERSSLYHAENQQEAFLVLLGECLLIVEEQERTLRQWDFFHAAPGTAHTFVGAGGGPCALLMAGTRRADEEIVYPVSETAARHGASARRETRVPDEAYTEAQWPESRPTRLRWPPA